MVKPIAVSALTASASAVVARLSAGARTVVVALADIAGALLTEAVAVLA
jgi:hypothetical protein